MTKSTEGRKTGQAQAVVTRPLRAFACRIAGSDHETTIHARSAGDAKARFLRSLDIDFQFISIRCRCAGEPVTTPDIRRTAEYRGVPFAKAGMRLFDVGKAGVIVGHNSSANWDVLFDDGTKWAGQVVNCHPNWEIAYFDDAGNVLRDFRKQASQAV